MAYGYSKVFNPNSVDVTNANLAQEGALNLLNSIDFTTAQMVCGHKLRQNRLRFVGGRQVKTNEETYDFADVVGNVISDGTDAQLSDMLIGSSGHGGLLRFFSLGISKVDGNKVNVKVGQVQQGSRALATVAAVELTISADDQYTGVQFTYGTTTATWIAPSTDINNFRSDATYYRCWIYRFHLSGAGLVTINEIGHIGNIELPGNFG